VGEASEPCAGLGACACPPGASAACRPRAPSRLMGFGSRPRERPQSEGGAEPHAGLGACGRAACAARAAGPGRAQRGRARQPCRRARCGAGRGACAGPPGAHAACTTDKAPPQTMFQSRPSRSPWRATLVRPLARGPPQHMHMPWCAPRSVQSSRARARSRRSISPQMQRRACARNAALHACPPTSKLQMCRPERPHATGTVTLARPCTARRARAIMRRASSSGASSALGAASIVSASTSKSTMSAGDCGPRHACAFSA
jgi:hypothetical protein